MASKLKVLLLLISLFFISTPLRASRIEAPPATDELSKNVTSILYNQGYISMGLFLENHLTALLSVASLANNNTASAITIFCPPEKTFVHLDYLDASSQFMLLQYHTAPKILEREDFNSTLSLGSRIENLLHGHPLLVTTQPSGIVSVNNVTIRQWDLYNDGRVIIHGMQQVLETEAMFRRWYSTMDNKTNSISASTSDLNKKRTTEISGTLFDLGYYAMSTGVEPILSSPSLSRNNTTSGITIFCLTNEALDGAYLEGPQSLQTLIFRYHAVPVKLGIDDFSALALGSKIDTLVPGHPLVVTGNTSINNVRITKWGIYNKGGVIIHGAEKALKP